MSQSLCHIRLVKITSLWPSANLILLATAFIGMDRKRSSVVFNAPHECTPLR